MVRVAESIPGARRMALAIFAATWLGAMGACGPAQPSMSVSVNVIAMNATTADPAPTTTVQIMVASPPSTPLYIGVNYTSVGIDNVSLASEAPAISPTSRIPRPTRWARPSTRTAQVVAVERWFPIGRPPCRPA